jgi:hypothetical protein
VTRIAAVSAALISATDAAYSSTSSCTQASKDWGWIDGVAREQRVQSRDALLVGHASQRPLQDAHDLIKDFEFARGVEEGVTASAVTNPNFCISAWAGFVVGINSRST